MALGSARCFISAWRLHLNKVMVTAAFALPFAGGFRRSACGSGDILQPDARPHLAWFVGSHIVAFIVAPAVALLVYAAAQLCTRDIDRRGKDK